MRRGQVVNVISRRQPVAWGVVVVLLAGCASPGSSLVQTAPVESRSTAALGSLAAQDLITIGQSAGLLSTRPHAHVQAVKAPGRVVWARFNPDVHNIDGSEYLAHDLIMVRSTDHVPDLSAGEDRARGGPAPAKTVAVWAILDASTGRVVEISGDGPTDVAPPDPAAIGTPSDVTLP